MNSFQRFVLAATGLVVCSLLAAPSDAAPIRLALESDENRQAGSEVFVANFDSTADLVAGSLSSGMFSELNIGASFSIGGMGYDGSYHVLLESDENRQGGSELFLASFDSYDDLLSGSLAAGSFSQLNIGANFGVGGLAYDGTAYRLVLESDENRQAGSEIFVASFDSIDDLLAGSLASGQFSQLNLGANFGVAGLDFDGLAYQILLESDENRQAGSELFLASFDSFDALLDGTLAAGTFSQLNLGANFSGGGSPTNSPRTRFPIPIRFLCPSPLR